mgnify:CR=1 FL=1
MCLLRGGKLYSGRKPPALSLLFLLGKIIEEDNNRMSKIAIVTDSNSGISQKEAKEMGIFVLPMPFLINGKEYLDGVDLLPEQFYEFLKEDADVATSQPSPASVMKLWEEVLKEYDEIVHIPMSSGLSGSCQTAMMLADDYDGKVQVVNNQRVSITQIASIADAQKLIAAGKTAAEVKEVLEKEALRSSIYVTVTTLKYLKKGGRITPAAAALGTMLRLKPVLQIHGEKLDAFAKARTVKQAKSIMIKAVKDDYASRFKECQDEMQLCIAYTGDISAAMEFHKEVEAEFGITDIMMDPLSLNVSCHIGPGALALACARKL